MALYENKVSLKGYIGKNAQTFATKQQNLFVVERSERALFMPPFRSLFLLKGAYRLENFGRYIIPGLAGLHIIEASKQVYGGIPVSAARTRNEKAVFVSRPAGIPT